MKRSSKNIAATVAELIAPTVNELGYLIWDVEYVKEGADYYLRITIDNENGIDIIDCEKVHRAVDPLLDEADPIEESYHLEVSSPGVERELKYDWHFEEFMGCEVEIKLYAPLDGVKSAVGELVSYSEDGIAIKQGEKETVFPLEKVAKVKTVFDFDSLDEE